MEVDLDSLRSSIVADLPSHARWTIKGTTLDYDFSRARAPLQSVEDDMGDYDISEWSNLFEFGECDYAEGGGAQPCLTIRRSDGSVYGFDPEREIAIFLVNSSIETFISTFRLLNEYLGKDKQLPLDLGDRVREIDPEAYPASEWRLLVEYLTDAEQSIS